MNITKFDYDLEFGFAWIELDSGDSVQCCLVQDQETGKFLEEIKTSDCGHDWGLCYDNNEGMFDLWGENRCMSALFEHAKNNGIAIEG